MMSAESRDSHEDVVDFLPFTAVERVLGVTPDAAQWTAGQADENGRPADTVRLTLQGVEYLGYTQASARIRLF